MQNRYFPEGSTKVTAKNSTAVVYLAPSALARMPQAIGYRGKAKNASFNFVFRTEQKRAEYVAKFFADVATSEAAATAYKAERKAEAAKPHSLEVGTVLYTCWGYDQTNIEYFEVTALVGRSMVEVREISTERVETGRDQGHSVPAPGVFIGAAQRKRVLRGNTLDMHNASFGRASPLEFQTVAGAKVYASRRWSSYA